MFQRSSGVLLHVTSLPGRYGSGTFGREARKFVDFLKDSGFSWWQVLPFSPPDLGNSPYTAYSAFAGNPLLIDPEGLAEEGLLTREDLETAVCGDPYTVRYSTVNRERDRLLRIAFSRCGMLQKTGIEEFTKKNPWVREYALFMALQEKYKMPWPEWPDNGLRLHDQLAVKKAETEYRDQIEFYLFVQWCFFSQWEKLHAYASEQGIGIIGDMPIYMSLNSSDVWANQKLFRLCDGRPDEVAGAPPDAFSEDGQLWGNPLYDYDAMERDGFKWWLDRIGAALRMFDAVRIDHFRGFSAYWSIPASSASAKEGHWAPGPGMKLFGKVAECYPDAPIIAEDLGVLDDAVYALRKETGFPGMRVMQFAFAPGNAPHLPHNYPVDCVAYTGTHDNNTTLGWLWESVPEVRDYACRYIGLNAPWQDGGPRSPACRAVMRCLWQSSAALTIVPFQDIMGWGEDTRMNRPGVPDGCWAVRIGPRALAEADRVWLRTLNDDFGRGGR